MAATPPKLSAAKQHDRHKQPEPWVRDGLLTALRELGQHIRAGCLWLTVGAITVALIVKLL